MTYPTFYYYPRWQAIPAWVPELIDIFAQHERLLNTKQTANKSDKALTIIRPALVNMGFDVEASKAKADKLYRPVFFGENGVVERQYQIDAYHPGHRIALEMEAVRAVLGNAIYRDIIQMSLLVDVDYAAVAVPLQYRYNSSGKVKVNESYDHCRTILDAIYGGTRLELPFKGFLLVGY